MQTHGMGCISSPTKETSNYKGFLFGLACKSFRGRILHYSKQVLFLVAQDENSL